MLWKSAGVISLAPRTNSGRERRRWLPGALFAFTLALYLPTVASEYVITDSHASAASAWRIANTGLPWMDGVNTALLEGSRFHDQWLVESSNGHMVIARMPGAIFPAVPFYAALNNDPDPADFEIWVGGVAASVVTALSGLFLFLTFRSKFTDGVALGATGSFLIATPVWSVGANALWTHNLTLLAVALSMFYTSRERWCMAGFALAVGIISRPHLAIIAAALGLFIGWKRRELRIIAKVGLSSAVGLLVLVLWNKFVFDSWSIAGGYAGGVGEKLEASPGSGILYHIANVIGLLFAPDRGLFIWTPALLVLIPSMLSNWRSLSDCGKAFAIGGLAYTLLQLRVNDFRGGQGFYGYRLSLELLLCLLPAALHAFHRTAKRTRLVVGALIGVQISAIAVGAINEHYYLDGADIWFSNAYLLLFADEPVVFLALTGLSAVGGAVVMFVGQHKAGWPRCTPAQETVLKSA